MQSFCPFSWDHDTTAHTTLWTTVPHAVILYYPYKTIINQYTTTTIHIVLPSASKLSCLHKALAENTFQWSDMQMGAKSPLPLQSQATIPVKESFCVKLDKSIQLSTSAQFCPWYKRYDNNICLAFVNQITHRTYLWLSYIKTQIGRISNRPAKAFSERSLHFTWQGK